MICKTPLEAQLFSALKRISQYQSPERINRSAWKDWGCAPQEALEMAYENVLEEARRATRGVRIAKPKASESP